MSQTLTRWLIIFAVFMLLARYAPGLGWLLVLLALLFTVLWLLHGAGRLPAPVATVVARLDARIPGAGARRPAPHPSPGPAAPGRRPAGPQDQPRKPSSRDRERLFKEAEQQISTLKGIDEVLMAVQNRLLDLAEDARHRRQAGFGILAPGIVVILAGASGVGKSFLARQFPALFCGQGAFEHNDCITLNEQDVTSLGYGASLYKLVEEKAGQALGCMLLLEDADWLMQTAAADGNPAASEAGKALLRVAEANPGKLFVTLTMTPSGSRKLLNDSQQETWLNKLQVELIEFPERLDNAVLFELLSGHLHKLGLEVEDSARKALQGHINTLRHDLGERFDNANAMRRVADRVAQQVVRRSAEGGALGGRRIVKVEDVRGL